MEHFIVSARKYRPKSFNDVIGQQAITNTLENAIKNNHLDCIMKVTCSPGVKIGKSHNKLRSMKVKRTAWQLNWANHMGKCLLTG